MTTLLWTGTIVGALLGLLHAVYVYRLMAAEAPADAPAHNGRALYYAAWTFGLWVLAGSYVLVLWIIGMVLYLFFKAFR